MEPTSEQELKQLLDEGRITEEEYRELLEAIRQKERVQKPVDVPEQPTEPKPRTGYGKAALILMIVGFLFQFLSLIVNVLLASHQQGPTPRMFVITGPFMLLGLFCEFLAFIFGIIGWKTIQGKIAAIGVPCLILLAPFITGFLMGTFFFVRATVENKPQENLVGLKAYPLDSTTRVITQDGVEFDEISTDGNGSLRIKNDSSEKKVIRLFETGPFDIENCMLIYSAKIRAEKLYGKTYLEMWCDIPGKGEFFSRGIEQPVTGTTVVWKSVQTPFRLEKGQMPSNVKLNLVIEGTGTVWIDDVKLLSSPLN